jgi:DNA repair ATPase RecN|tara:strand:- start:279 stop:878 length:600 start_codon:yes stop_codon:yes gene_type:complete
MNRDLKQELENVEEGIENFKNKEFRILGLKITFMSVSALIAVLGSVLGALYGGFLIYQKVEEAIAFVDQQQEYEEKISNYDNRMQIIETQLDEAIGYARDIKGDLRDDILSIEKSVDRVEDKVREVEGEVREIIQNAEERFENKRDGLQNDYDEKANRLQESNQSRMDDLEAKVERDLKNLEDTLNKKLQRALDNPLAN